MQLYADIPTTSNVTLRAICKKFHKWKEDIQKTPANIMICYITKAWNYYAIGRDMQNICIGKDVKHVDFISAQQVEDLK